MDHRRTHPPGFMIKFLRWFCPDHLLEEIEGDLIQVFEQDVKAMGIDKARRRFVWNVLRFFRPGIVLRNRISWRIIDTVMFANYFKVASRNILKRKLFSFINAFGLSVGIAFCILIYLFIRDERSFDRFHANKDRIFRMHGVVFNRDYLNDPATHKPFSKAAHLPLGLAEAMKEDLPEVEYATRFCSGRGVLRYEDKVFNESFVYADADFFKMFSFRLISGNADELFKSKDEIVLTPALAGKYFSDADPLGKVLQLDNRSLTVTGIIESPPANSSLDFKAIVPIEGWRAYNERNLSQWRNLGFPTFVQLFTAADTAKLQPKLVRLTEKHMASSLIEWRRSDNIPSGFEPFRLGYTPLQKVHFEHEIGWHKVSNPQYSWILGGIATLIVVIACINYVSLALTTSAGRRREVGVRKAIGAHKRQLVYQFGVESIVLAQLSMFFAIGLVWFFLPSFNDFTGKSIAVGLEDFFSLLGLGVCLALVIGLLAGSYPALLVSGFSAVQALKGATSRLRAGFATPLIVVQFSLSGFLMISSVIMYRQMRFITTRDLGYNEEQVVVIPTQAGWDENSEAIVENFRKEASMDPSVVAVTAIDHPFAGFDIMRFGFEVDGQNKNAYGFSVDPWFVSTMEIQLVEGRDFDPADRQVIIVNEALVKDMGWTAPLQEHLNYHMSDSTGPGAKVIGVVKDFHFLSLAQKIEPMFLTLEGRLANILVKISPEDMPETLKELEADFRKVAPGKPFEYSFLDQNVARQYESFDQWMNIMALSTAFAMLISCLGLFGLAGINAVNRTKEIGIRKVMGAELPNIFILLNKEFIGISLLAFIIAAPLSWYAMQEWLSRFEFRIDMGWPLFAVSMLAGLAVALLTVSYHSFKAALINPADTLKYE